MQLIALGAATDANGVPFTVTDIEISKTSDVSICPLIAGANWNGGNVLVHVQAPGTTDWYDTGVILTSAAPGAVMRIRQGFKYRLVPTIPGASLLLTFMIH